MAKGGYSINDIYQGGYSSLKPNYGDVFVGYHASAENIGMSSDARTANVVKEISKNLSAGAKTAELSQVSPEVFDAIPKQQLKELNRLSKLTGVDITVHAPVTDSAGINQQGFSELNREASERRIADALMRSHEINPEGNSPVTFHSSKELPGSEWETLGTKEKPREAKKIIAIDRESGKMIPLEKEEYHYPGRKEETVKGIPHTPQENLEIANESEWDNKISQLFFNKERADEILDQNKVQIQHLIEGLQNKTIDPRNLTPSQESAFIKMQDAENYLKEIHKSANSIFSKAYKFGNDLQKKQLIEISDKYGREIEASKKNGESVAGQSKAVHKLLNDLQNPELAPEMYVPIEEFTTEQSSKSFGNASFESFKKFGDKAPILSIENPPAGGALSTGEDLRNLVEASRKQFVKRAVEEKGMREREAEKLAEQFIGATWDVGHINMLRAQGFESKNIIEETKKVAPLVKHVHLSDNFGFEHAELPMGMGNVPVKEIMAKLDSEGYKGKKIVEAISWWQHFSEQGAVPPLKATLQALGSPLYSMEMGPSWNQTIGLQQGYNSGYGMMLPQGNYEMMGAGFSQLPTELGGQKPGAGGSRMSGKPME